MRNPNWDEVVNNDEDIAEANDIAARIGFDKAVYRGEWQGYKVFEPELNGGEATFTGLPVLILVEDGEGRITKGNEIFSCYDAVVGNRADAESEE